MTSEDWKSSTKQMVLGFEFNISQMLAVWKTLPLAVMWLVWRSRNDCVFNKVQPDWIALEDLIKARVALWVSSSLKGFNYSVHDVIYNLYQVCHCV